MPHVLSAFLRDRLPWIQIAGLRRNSPAGTL
uniref:Uncharacterized protein n=1 Tax=Rhizophora mucronata TaxID=61149 RepID=A0A2P2PS93_RHIMU